MLKYQKSVPYTHSTNDTDTLSIHFLIAQLILQHSEGLQEALKSNDCNRKCRCLLSRECLLIVEGYLKKEINICNEKEKYAYCKNSKSMSRCFQSLLSN